MTTKLRTKSRKLSTEGTVGAAMVAAICLLAIVGPLLSPYDPNATDILASLEAPSWAHWMGTDATGRDVLARAMAGTRASLVAAISVTMIVLVVGTVVGTVSAYFGGWADAVLSRIIDTAVALPFLVVILTVVAILGVGTTSVAIGMIIVGWAVYARIARAEVLALRESEFILATRSLGFSTGRVVFRHVLPNIVRPGVTFATMDGVSNLLVFASLSYLGFGAQPPAADLGSIIAGGQPYLLSAWWISTLPAILLVILGIGVGLLDDGFAYTRRKVRGK